MSDVAVKQGAPPPPGSDKPISYRKLLVWSIRVVAHAPWSFAFSVLLGVAALQLMQYSLDVVTKITDALRAGTVENDLAWLAVYFLALTVLLAVTRVGGRIVSTISDFRMLRSLQQSLHDRIIAQGASYHDKHDVSETSTIVLQDAGGAQAMLRDFIAFPVTQGIGLVTAVLYLFNKLMKLGDLPWWLLALLFLGALTVPICGYWLVSRLRSAFFVAREALADVNREYLNSASSPLEIQLLGALPQRSQSFGRRLDALVASRMRAQIRMQVANEFQSTAPALLQGVFVVVGLWIALTTHSVDAGAIVGIYFFVPFVTSPVQQIISFMSGLQMTWVQVTRIGELLDLPDPAPTAAVTPAIDATAPNVALDQVTFTYPGADAPVLRELSHVFAPGAVTAIVGRSGSGKSSILSLIDGLRPPDRGTIRVGGRAIAEIDPAAFRAQIAVVSQLPLFIADTIRANYQLAKPDVTDAEIEESCRRIGVWATLERGSPHAPLDFQVSRTLGGGGLSGGERRLISVARVLLRRPSLLLLDEPTTGVDSESIDKVARLLGETVSGKTVIVVEHNLDFVKRIANQICCLDQGVFADIGTPAELEARPSLFRSLLDARERIADVGDIAIERHPIPAIALPPKAAGPVSAFAKKPMPV